MIATASQAFLAQPIALLVTQVFPQHTFKKTKDVVDITESKAKGQGDEDFDAVRILYHFIPWQFADKQLQRP